MMALENFRSSISFSYKCSNGQRKKSEEKKEVQKFEYLQNKKSYLSKLKSIFHDFLSALFC